ncbi:LOW QUALITY PROTEIN: serine/arginine-rich splicing factor 5-like [Xenia sp. Carnegie-2017]|uniref:LOW QUALITY PROTEIN: serine/arginine-rich splicing factor 5-like n=1 Tax=Xenia sp. Carnegie-2017 TaxID=2897299 RepID=UPI001F04DB13|nr:LOW QUALITY PROTEIN: serine/arginine-rich splicing factor 5-like [Xenia sp. Carnegie-2017]
MKTSLLGNAKALVKAGGENRRGIQTLESPLFSTQYTGAGKLLVNQIAHVIGPGKPSYEDLKKCLKNFFDDLSGKGITDVSFRLHRCRCNGFLERESVALIFDNISRMALSKNPTLNLVRIVIFEKGKFDQFKDATKTYFSSEPDARRNSKKSFKSFKSFKFGKPKIKSVFGRLPEALTQDEFEKLIAEFGKARNIEWKSGFAYVDYKHSSDASKTVQNLNGKEVGGNNILVELAQNGAGGYAVAGAMPLRSRKTPASRPVRTPHRIRIENLSSRARWMELKELVSLAGEVMFADTHKRKTGEGIVEFASRKDLEEAKMFHNTKFYGRTIKLYDESPGARKMIVTISRPLSSSFKKEEGRSYSKSPSPRRESRHGSRSASSEIIQVKIRAIWISLLRTDHATFKKRSRSKERKSSSKKRYSRSNSPQSNSHKKSKSPSIPIHLKTKIGEVFELTFGSEKNSKEKIKDKNQSYSV